MKMLAQQKEELSHACNTAQDRVSELENALRALQESASAFKSAAETAEIRAQALLHKLRNELTDLRTVHSNCERQVCDVFERSE